MTRVERRRSERIPFSEDIVVFAKGQRLTCRSTDLSEGGIGLEPPAKARPGLHLIVDVDLDGGQTVAIEGFVVREEDGDNYRWGVRFHDVSPRVQQLLAAFVARERQRRPQVAPAAPQPAPAASGFGELPARPQARQQQSVPAPAAAAAPRSAPLPTPAADPPDVLDRINTAEQLDLRQVQAADQNEALERDLEDALSKLYYQALKAIDNPLDRKKG